jgi:hypothetical protein
MAFSYVNYTGNGTITQFVVPFPYINQSHVRVFVANVEVAITWNDPGTVVVSPAPASGAVVRVERFTPVTASLVDFADDSVLDEALLDLMNDQLFYLAQEATDQAEAATVTANSAVTSANTAVATSVAANTKADAAVTTSATAVTTASAATTTAAAAVATSTAALAQIQNALAGSVSSFNGREGAVLPASGDYTAAQVSRGLGTVEETLTGIEETLTTWAAKAPPYAAGIVITNYNQSFVYLGEFYVPSAGLVLPYTTTGVGAAEVATFRSVGDATLRSDLAALGGLDLIGAGTIVRDTNKVYVLQGKSGEDGAATLTRGLAVELNESITGSANASTYRFNSFTIADDQVDAQNDGTLGTKVDGLFVSHKFGGVNTRGGRHALENFLIQTSPTATDNTDRNYVGVAASCQTSTGDGGLSGAGLGGYFGANLVASHTGGRYVFNLTGCEFNTSITAQPGGNEVNYHSGLQIVNGGTVQGYTIDAAIAVGTKGGVGVAGLPRVPWRNVFRVGRMNGGDPLGTLSSILVVDSGTPTIAAGFEIPRCTGNILSSGNVSLSNNTFIMGAAASGIEIGSVDTVSSARVDFHSSGTTVDYDSRIIASGGSATLGAGTIAIIGGNVQLTAAQEVVTTGVVRPASDNANPLGRVDKRYTVLYAATGTINTSDERLKQQIKPIDAAALRAWANVEYTQYKFSDAVEAKGGAARWHFGLIAQKVQEVFAAEGLDAFDYGLLCYDKWAAEDAVYGEDGEVVTPAIAAGNRYGVRYDEALVLECAYLRSRLS